MKNALLALVLALALPALASPPGEVMHSWLSPSAAVEAQAFFQDADSARKIFLHSAGDNAEWVFLCEFPRDASLAYSPNEEWIAVNDYMGSNIAEIRLFKRCTPLHYSETNQDPSTAAWLLLRKLRKVPYQKGLDHVYSEVVCWSSDSTCFLVRVWGHTDMFRHVDDWFCIYQVNLNRASVDLELMNRKAVVFRSPRK